jgi:galactokinase
LKNHAGMHELRNLCDLNMKSFESLRLSLSDPVLEKRAHHVISENERVGEAAKALKAGQLIEFGQLMYASHRSLRDLYEVSGPELDAIIEYCEGDEHCIGARMTGAGFGGCAIALVQKEMLEHFTNGLTNHYIKKTGYAPTVFDSAPGAGVREEEFFLGKGNSGDKSEFQF